MRNDKCFYEYQQLNIPFYRSALYTTRSFLSHSRLSVRPSVRPSVTRVYCDKTNDSSADILMPYHPSFPTRRMVGREHPLLPEVWAKLTPPPLQKRRFPI